MVFNSGWCSLWFLLTNLAEGHILGLQREAFVGLSETTWYLCCAWFPDMGDVLYSLANLIQSTLAPPDLQR